MSNIKYPWNAWFKRLKEFELRRGEDFHCLPSTFRNLAHVAARDRNMRVNTRLDGNRVFIRVTERLGIYKKRKKDE